MLFSKLEAVVIVSVISFLGGVIFGENQTIWAKSTATIAVTEAQGQYLLNAKDKCECGKTVDYQYFD
ncbi:MAG: hypothetical protein AB4372_14520 [Xenococcus sp. (in: cyanobacteria)]